MERVFLKAPLDFRRISSRFTRRRYHPVLGRRRAHLGTDYAADRGTPVHTTGDGTVTRAGRWGGYGRIVEIRHINGYRTRYAHLSWIARGIRP
ncbi:MAG: M23 family metallopeptidase, partial [Actinobacteria bacterium]|nr:M23 family metallopeptidase [Actinomycetota bacterium]NIS35599.1 M23 family metallopeptidase [Actinomycetota bacterium]NIU70254.1 M23 family metallopeptidase [Actinomycetota bacterium]NIW32139.1 peptidoglycan DD-metalloendopeptidase family protein [Actinomycetota bacterium]